MAKMASYKFACFTTFQQKLEDSIEQSQWISSARPLWEVRRGFVPRFEAEIGVVQSCSLQSSDTKNMVFLNAIFRAREDACISSPSKRKGIKEHKRESSTS